MTQPITAWLIEKKGSEGPLWLTLTTFMRTYVSSGGNYYTETAENALKFYDMHSAAEYIRHNQIRETWPTEHIFD